MSYLPDHADAARIALALAERESAHLGYTHRTLYAEPIDLAWVEALARREDPAEKIDAFVGRFGRLQDHIGEEGHEGGDPGDPGNWGEGGESQA
jgi:hypothetical protein